MGVYASVMLPCPRCGERHEAQSKSGDCGFYADASEAPDDVMADVNRHAPFLCEQCGELFYVGKVYVTVPVADPRDLPWVD